jgi:hypothetical protein
MLGLALPVEAALDAERDVEIWMKEFDLGGDSQIDKPEFEVALTRCGPTPYNPTLPTRVRNLQLQCHLKWIDFYFSKLVLHTLLFF